MYGEEIINMKLAVVISVLVALSSANCLQSTMALLNQQTDSTNWLHNCKEVVSLFPKSGSEEFKAGLYAASSLINFVQFFTMRDVCKEESICTKETCTSYDEEGNCTEKQCVENELISDFLGHCHNSAKLYYFTGALEDAMKYLSLNGVDFEKNTEIASRSIRVLANLVFSFMTKEKIEVAINSYHDIMELIRKVKEEEDDGWFLQSAQKGDIYYDDWCSIDIAEFLVDSLIFNEEKEEMTQAEQALQVTKLFNNFSEKIVKSQCI